MSAEYTERLEKGYEHLFRQNILLLQTLQLVTTCINPGESGVGVAEAGLKLYWERDKEYAQKILAERGNT